MSADDHGTAGTYTNWGCRCPACRAANTASVLHRRRRRALEIKVNPTLAPHGKATTYQNWGCRCRPCTEAKASADRDYRIDRRQRAEGAA